MLRKRNCLSRPDLNRGRDACLSEIIASGGVAEWLILIDLFRKSIKIA
jgi:hypothetical protein